MEAQGFRLTQEDQKALVELKVAALILFGSHALGLAQASSDYDIGVLLKDKSLLKERQKRWELYDSLYELLDHRTDKLVNIDIVFLEEAPLDLKTHVLRYGQPLFEIDDHVFPNFKEKVMLEAADFEPYRKMFHQQILDRIEDQPEKS